MIIGYEERGGENLRYAESDLFIVTPEPELSEFEKAVDEIYESCGVKQLAIKKISSRLLELAKKELCEGGEITDWYAKGKAEALRTRATELTENLVKSGLDKDSIPYNLIEFMCNLYDCQNWKEIEETAELYVTRIKAAALKDLPRWNESRGIYRDGWINDGFLYYKNHSIQLSSLEKLPGFKED